MTQPETQSETQPETQPESPARAPDAAEEPNRVVDLREDPGTAPPQGDGSPADLEQERRPRDYDRHAVR